MICRNGLFAMAMALVPSAMAFQHQSSSMHVNIRSAVGLPSTVAPRRFTKNKNAFTSLRVAASPSDFRNGSKKEMADSVDGPGIWPCGDELDKRLMKIAIPMILAFMVTPLMGAIDLFFVSRMANPLAVAGQAASNQIYNTAFWLTSFLPSGT